MNRRDLIKLFTITPGVVAAARTRPLEEHWATSSEVKKIFRQLCEGLGVMFDGALFVQATRDDLVERIWTFMNAAQEGGFVYDFSLFQSDLAHPGFWGIGAKWQVHPTSLWDHYDVGFDVERGKLVYR